MIDVKYIPDELKQGENWQLLDIDPDWLWIVRDREDRIVGFLLACNCHGLVLIWRLRMTKGAPRYSLLRLLRGFIKDIRARGCLGYAAMLDLEREEERALYRIAFRAKGIFLPKAVSVILGSVNTGHLGES